MEKLEFGPQWAHKSIAKELRFNLFGLDFFLS